MSEAWNRQRPPKNGNMKRNNERAEKFTEETQLILATLGTKKSTEPRIIFYKTSHGVELAPAYKNKWIKVAEHSFSARFCWCKLARAQGFQKQTCRQQSDRFICSKPALSVLFFSAIACSVLMALVFYYHDMLQKVTMQRTQHFQLLFVTERTQLNATHAQLLEKLRPIA